MSTKENEGRKIILGDTPLEELSVFEQMEQIAIMIRAMFENIPTECAMAVCMEYLHCRCHDEGLNFLDFLDSSKACAEMIENDSMSWF